MKKALIDNWNSFGRSVSWFLFVRKC